MNDPRLGKRDIEKGVTQRPTQTISGLPIDGSFPPATIGLADGHFAILDFRLSDLDRDRLVAELNALIKAKQASPKDVSRPDTPKPNG